MLRVHFYLQLSPRHVTGKYVLCSWPHGPYLKLSHNLLRYFLLLDILDVQFQLSPIFLLL